jgi:hypothetical protein
MRNKIYHITFGVLLLMGLWACETKYIEPSVEGRLGWEYFPLEIGEYKVYEVEETRYALTEPRETFRKFFLKEVVVDSFLNQEKNLTYVLHRLTKESEQEQWSLDSVWTVRRNEKRVIVVENNIPFVKLIFPVKNARVWDGNAFNHKGKEEYVMEKVDQPLLVNDILFDQTLNVVQSNNPDQIIFQDMRNEVYARGVGLVFKESVILKFCAQSNCIGEGIIDTGREYKQSIIAYGKE